MSDSPRDEPAQPELTPEQIEMQARWDAAWNNRRNWHLGVFYYAPDDPRPWVPKRGLLVRAKRGSTPNLANPMARRHLGVILSILLGVLLVLVTLDRLGVLG